MMKGTKSAPEVVISSPLMAFLLDGAVYDQGSDAEGLLFGRKQRQHKFKAMTDGPGPSAADDGEIGVRFVVEYFVVLGKRYEFYDRNGTVANNALQAFIDVHTPRNMIPLGWFRATRGRNIDKPDTLTTNVSRSLATQWNSNDDHLPLCLLLTELKWRQQIQTTEHQLYYYNKTPSKHEKGGMSLATLTVENMLATARVDDFWADTDDGHTYEFEKRAGDVSRITEQLVDTSIKHQMKHFEKRALEVAKQLDGLHATKNRQGRSTALLRKVAGSSSPETDQKPIACGRNPIEVTPAHGHDNIKEEPQDAASFPIPPPRFMGDFVPPGFEGSNGASPMTIVSEQLKVMTVNNHGNDCAQFGSQDQLDETAPWNYDGPQELKISPSPSDFCEEPRDRRKRVAENGATSSCPMQSVAPTTPLSATAPVAKHSKTAYGEVGKQFQIKIETPPSTPMVQSDAEGSAHVTYSTTQFDQQQPSQPIVCPGLANMPSAEVVAGRGHTRGLLAHTTGGRGGRGRGRGLTEPQPLAPSGQQSEQQQSNNVPVTRSSAKRAARGLCKRNP